jgi:hypothetical protein
MNRVLVILFVLTLIAGCGYDNRITDLESKVAKLSSRSVMDLAPSAGANFYPCRGIDGGATGDLDKIASPSIGDSAFVVLNEDALYGNAMFVYVYTDFGAAISEALPYEVKPDTGDSANYAWSLVYTSAMVPVMMTGNLTLTLGQQNAGIVHANAAGTLTLQGAATIGFGKTICVYVEDVSETVIIGSATAEDIFNLHGTPQAAGDVIDSPGNAGDFICLVSSTDADGGGTDGYITLGYGEEAWADGGAS